MSWVAVSCHTACTAAHDSSSFWILASFPLHVAQAGLIDAHHLLDLHQLASIVADHVLANTPRKEDSARKRERPLILFEFFDDDFQLEMPRHAMCLAIELATTPALVKVSGNNT